MSGSTAHERLARLVKGKGWTQEEAAVELDCHQTMVSRILSGKRKPGRTTAARIEEISADSPEGPIRVGDWDDNEEAPARRIARAPKVGRDRASASGTDVQASEAS